MRVTKVQPPSPAALPRQQAQPAERWSARSDPSRPRAPQHPRPRDAGRRRPGLSEGAFAVAGPNDHGRVGSHRYLTCVPVDGLATAEFIWFYLQTHEGISKVQAASPGSADRNRTLGQNALEAITVPAPPFNHQHWFNSIQTKAREARAIRASTANDVEALIPAMLHEIFNGKAAD